MNERIEKLFDQALEEFKAENQYAIIVVPDSLQRDFVAKFAELIVKECAELFPERHYYYSGPAVKRDIKKHFGVEE